MRLADPKDAAEEIDLWCHGWNYASHGESKKGADDILQKEREEEWHPNSVALEARHGQVSYSRIGVIRKIKDNAVELRLMHGLRRSGVNQKVCMTECIVLPRIVDVTMDILSVSKEKGAQQR